MFHSLIEAYLFLGGFKTKASSLRSVIKLAAGGCLTDFKDLHDGLVMSDQVSYHRRLLYDIQQRWGHCDLYRETPIRFLGYANEVGEAFRAWVPRQVVQSTYVVAIGYVIGDAANRTHLAAKRSYPSVAERHRVVGLTLLDTLAWQSFASVILPGLLINRLCATTAAILKRTTKLSPAPLKLFTTALGLATIPFIVKPIDACVDVGMDRTLRQLYSLNRD